MWENWLEWKQKSWRYIHLRCRGSILQFFFYSSYSQDWRRFLRVRNSTHRQKCGTCYLKSSNIFLNGEKILLNDLIQVRLLMTADCRIFERLQLRWRTWSLLLWQHRDRVAGSDTTKGYDSILVTSLYHVNHKKRANVTLVWLFI